MINCGLVGSTGVIMTQLADCAVKKATTFLWLSLGCLLTKQEKLITPFLL